MSGLRAPDAHTLEVELVRPDLTFLYVAAMPYLAPVPREEVENPTVEARTATTISPSTRSATGPFVLKEWQRGLRMRLERDPHYWDRATRRPCTPSK